MAPRTSVPILLLTGFLGSGKTSLLARWLREPEFAGAMVIVNELGEVGLDDRLVETSSEAPLLLENGCACCAASEDLAATLERLFFDRLHRVIPKFSWVLIETTGVAEPQPIIDLIAGNSLVAERYHLEAVVTCFDARRGPMLLATQPECRKQIEAASSVVITKTDLVDDADLAFARAAVEQLRPDVRVLLSGRGALTQTLTLPSPASGRGALPVVETVLPPLPQAGEGWGEGLPAAALLAELAHAKAAPACALDHVHGPDCSHEHYHHDHDHGHAHAHLADVSTAFAPLDAIAREALEGAIALVLAEFGDDLLRVKGIVRLLGEPELQVVQAEAGLPVEFTALPTRAGDEPATGMTLIARGQPARDMAAALQACVMSATYVERRGCAGHV